ncbi:REP element-mobilizing transposase RayT [Algoriphagus sp. 4150]|uniref:IS200/IS605 family transposase n=1 Tax=Algoriphagus sp. 4150 TaxID=2817756 RepID=UPI0028571C34|nr:IS200/IS605 family transposase [Algoriphagus sp. 4150]MDR7131584.1 REP element-mobilizing transposase RayT [Algoriphagus sp. 4150]
MANTFSQIYLHLVFAVQNRNALINPRWELELYQYISGIIRNKGQKPMIVNGMPDHIHLLVGIKPNLACSDLVQEIKKSSNKWVNESKHCRFKFKWQDGFGAFSISQSHVDRTYKYIANQKEHHRKKTFKEEYLLLLEKYKIDFKDEYLFEWL